MVCAPDSGFSKDEASLFRYRCIELKHGRVAMLAVLGTLVQVRTTIAFAYHTLEFQASNSLTPFENACSRS